MSQRSTNALNDAEIVTMIRLCSAIDSANKASAFSDGQLITAHRYLCAKGFRFNQAVEIVACAPTAFSDSNPMAQEFVDVLKLQYKSTLDILTFVLKF